MGESEAQLYWRYIAEYEAGSGDRAWRLKNRDDPSPASIVHDPVAGRGRHGPGSGHGCPDRDRGGGSRRRRSSRVLLRWALGGLGRRDPKGGRSIVDWRGGGTEPGVPGVPLGGHRQGPDLDGSARPRSPLPRVRARRSSAPGAGRGRAGSGLGRGSTAAFTGWL